MQTFERATAYCIETKRVLIFTGSLVSYIGLVLHKLFLTIFVAVVFFIFIIVSIVSAIVIAVGHLEPLQEVISQHKVTSHQIEIGAVA